MPLGGRLSSTRASSSNAYPLVRIASTRGAFVCQEQPVKTTDNDAERWLCGALLTSPKLALAGAARAGLWPGAFSSRRLAELYARIQKGHGQHQALEELVAPDLPYYELLGLQCDFADTAEKGRDKDFSRYIYRKLRLGIAEAMPNTPLDVTAYSLAKRIVGCAMARRKLMEVERMTEPPPELGGVGI